MAMPLFHDATLWAPRRDERPTVRLLDKALMAHPEHFRVASAHNIHMTGAGGVLNAVATDRAVEQWLDLIRAFEMFDIDVCEIAGTPELPDLVFTANPSMALPLPDGSTDLWLGRMRHAERQPEVELHRAFFQEQGFTPREMPDAIPYFEGTGDAIHHPHKHLLHAGVGDRSDLSAWEHLATVYPELDILVYRLQDERFYHLDTALVPITAEACLYVPCAFDQAGLALIQAAFPNAIPIPESEALNFAGNAWCANDRDVVLHQGSPETEALLVANNFAPFAVDTSEFLKSGGSVFCMKQAW